VEHEQNQPAVDRVGVQWAKVGRLVCFVVALVGCYEPPVDTCGIICTDTCPGKLVCTPEHVCRNVDGTCSTPAIDFASVGTGARHVCGLDLQGSIWCWGDNNVGQLGIADVTQASAPALVGDPEVKWSELSVGAEHTCGITDHQVMCWGQNGDGQVAGSKAGTYNVPTPVQFAGTTPRFDHVAAGGSQSCALSAGTLWCWGREPQNGVGAVTVATQVGSLTDWTAISTGFDHTCGLSESQGVLCWGTNGHDQTGTVGGSVTAPQPVAMPMPATKIVAGDLVSCAILVDGTLWCWGFNNGSQTITNLPMDYAVPTQIGTEGGWTSVSMSARRICGVRDGIARCWGTSNLGGLGDGLWSEFILPHESASQIGAADSVSLNTEAPLATPTAEIGCMLTGTKLSCWGENSHGELGLGFQTRHKVPIAIHAPNGMAWQHVYSGRRHTCATTIDGQLWCWGADYYGQVSAGGARGADQPCIDGQPCDQPIPVRGPSAIGTIDELIAGNDYSCVRTGATVRCWGDSGYGQLGVDTPIGHSVETVEPTTGAWTKLYGGDRATCGVTTANKLECWGYFLAAYYYTPTDQTDPELHDLTSLHVGDDSVCAARSSDHSRVCWGGNGNGQLGNGTTTSATIAAYDVGTIAEVAFRATHTCALTTAGGVKCFGSNSSLEAGVATGGMIPTPSVVAATDGPLHDCTAIAVGPDYSCAICSATVYCWGRSSRNETGNRTVTLRNIADLAGVPPELHFTELALGDTRACALDDQGALYCWGDGPHGETGDGSHASALPVAVGSP
jgi:alpha-tubulin suppressor-like RCC1 family protein